jgi:hypothetical protein
LSLLKTHATLLAFNLQFGSQSLCSIGDSQRRFFGLFGPGFGLGRHFFLLAPHGDPEEAGGHPVCGSANIYIVRRKRNK